MLPFVCIKLTNGSSSPTAGADGFWFCTSHRTHQLRALGPAGAWYYKQRNGSPPKEENCRKGLSCPRDHDYLLLLTMWPAGQYVVEEVHKKINRCAQGTRSYALFLCILKLLPHKLFRCKHICRGVCACVRMCVNVHMEMLKTKIFKNQKDFWH